MIIPEIGDGEHKLEYNRQTEFDQESGRTKGVQYGLKYFSACSNIAKASGFLFQKPCLRHCDSCKVFFLLINADSPTNILYIKQFPYSE